MLVVKNPPANTGDARDVGSIPGSRRSSQRRRWQPAPVFLPENFEWRSQVSESDKNELPSTSIYLFGCFWS